MSLPLLRWSTSYPKRGRSCHTPPAVRSRTTPTTPDGFGSALPPPRSVSDRPANKNRRAKSNRGLVHTLPAIVVRTFSDWSTDFEQLNLDDQWSVRHASSHRDLLIGIWVFRRGVSGLP